MAYVPKNLSVYIAAYSGALTGMGVSNRILTDASPASYTGLTQIAGAFAEEFDTVRGSAPSSELELQSISGICGATWFGRSPQEIAPFFTPSTYLDMVTALLALLSEEGTYFANQGIPTTNEDQAALAQGGWWIDPVLGNDANDGSQAFPLKTHAQLAQRLGKGNVLTGQFSNIIAPIQLVTVHLVGDLPPSDPIDIDVKVNPDTLLAYLGTITSVRTGVLTGVTAKNRTAAGGGQPWEIADAATPFTASDIRKRIRITAGPNAGQMAYIAADLGGGIMRTSSFTDSAIPDPGPPDLLIIPATTDGIVAIGDPYVIETLSTAVLRSFELKCPLAGTSIFYGGLFGAANIEWKSTGPYLPFSMTASAISGSGSGASTFKGCLFEGWHQITRSCQSPRPEYYNCLYDALVIQGCPVVIRSGLQLGFAGTTVRDGGIPIFDNDFMVQDGVFIIFGGSPALALACVFDAPPFYMGAIEVALNPVGLPPASVYNGDGYSGNHQLWGNGNTTPAFLALSGRSSFMYQSNIPNGVAGGPSDFTTAGTTSSRAWDETAGAVTAPIANTWTKLGTPIGGGGFGGSAHEYTNSVDIVMKG